ncbi:MAG TPA: hypothetical protein VMV93_13350 [Chloroflexota bacterium]|nr:hypothetical protein [Chloroflexota bacterium]
MAIVVLHNGHLNVDRNPDAGLHGETGAEGELAWIGRLQDALQARLEAAGHTVKRTDGSGPDQDFGGDLFLANHYDGGAPDSSHCMAAHALNDTTPADSERLLRCFLARYPATVGIPARQELVTADMTRYYGFAYEAQPDLIVEHGNNSNAHDHAILHGQLGLVVQATFDVLQDYFGQPDSGANSTNGGASMPKATAPGSAARPLYHYLLWADSFQFRLPQAQAYLDRFKASNGWSVDDAAQAQHVTIVGPGHLLVDVEQRLQAAGVAVERIAGDDTAAPFAELLARDARFAAGG